MKKITSKDLWARVAKGEPVYLMDSCKTDAGYMIRGSTAIVKYPGVAPFEVKSTMPSIEDAILCGHEITEAEFNAI